MKPTIKIDRQTGETIEAIEVKLSNQMAKAYLKALDSLRRYKFFMFGYWAAQWVTLNKLLPSPRPNPFKSLVDLAKEIPKIEAVK